MDMANSKTLRAAIFDMDGLLFDTESIGRWAWTEALAEVGLTMTDELYRKLVGKDMASRRRILYEYFGAGLPFEQVKERRLAIGDERERGGGLAAKPGARELVAALAAAGVPLALGTGTERERAQRRLRDGGMDHFDVIVTSADVGVGKPAPDIFLEAARRLGVAPDDCAVFEDSPAGVAAAERAGMAVFVVPDLEAPTAEELHIARAVAADLVSLLPEVERAFGVRLGR